MLVLTYRESKTTSTILSIIVHSILGYFSVLKVVG